MTEAKIFKNSRNYNIIYSVQILRGIAAMLVVLHHAFLQISFRDNGNVFGVGQMGVDIFFVISGIVVYITAIRVDWTEFIKRRIVRIVPLYWFFMTLKIVFISIFNSVNIINYKYIVYVMCSFFFIPCRREDGGVFPLVTAGWTLNFEMYFYLISAVSLAIFQVRQFRTAATFAIAFGIILGCFVGSTHPQSELPAAVLLLSPISLEFLAGIWIGSVWVSRPIAGTMNDNHRNWAVLVFGAGVFSVFFAPTPELPDIYRFIYWGLPAIAIVGASVMTENRINYRRFKLPLFLGDASYAIYLAHTAVLPFADKFFARLDRPVAGLLLFTISILFGCMVHIFIEKPLVKWAGYLFKLHSKKPLLHASIAEANSN